MVDMPQIVPGTKSTPPLRRAEPLWRATAARLSLLCVSPLRPSRYLFDSRNPRRNLFPCAASLLYSECPIDKSPLPVGDEHPPQKEHAQDDRLNE
jgi:hypothetical protein